MRLLSLRLLLNLLFENDITRTSWSHLRTLMAKHQPFYKNSQFLQISGYTKSSIELGILNAMLNPPQLNKPLLVLKEEYTPWKLYRNCVHVGTGILRHPHKLEDYITYLFVNSFVFSILPEDISS